MRLVEEDSRSNAGTWRSTAEPLLLLEARVSHASGNESWFLEAHRRWRFHRVGELQSLSARRVLTLRHALRHGD